MVVFLPVGHDFKSLRTHVFGLRKCNAPLKLHLGKRLTENGPRARGTVRFIKMQIQPPHGPRDGNVGLPVLASEPF